MIMHKERSMMDEQYIDKAVFADFREVADDMLPEMVNSYIASSENLLGVMATALKDGNRKALSEGAHTLKSASGQIGALGLKLLAQKMEQDAVVLTPEQLAAALLDITGTFAAVREQLRATI